MAKYKIDQKDRLYVVDGWKLTVETHTTNAYTMYILHMYIRTYRTDRVTGAMVDTLGADAVVVKHRGTSCQCPRSLWC